LYPKEPNSSLQEDDLHNPYGKTPAMENTIEKTHENHHNPYGKTPLADNSVEDPTRARYTELYGKMN